jgi:hypothetical protein
MSQLEGTDNPIRAAPIASEKVRGVEAGRERLEDRSDIAEPERAESAMT